MAKSQSSPAVGCGLIIVISLIIYGISELHKSIGTNGIIIGCVLIVVLFISIIALFLKPHFCHNCQKELVTQDKLNLCNRCSSSILLWTERHIQILQESISIVNETKKIETFLSRHKLIVDILNQFVIHENKGIPLLNPSASSQLEVAISGFEGAVYSLIELKVIEILEKANEMKSLSSRVTTSIKAKTFILQYKSLFNNNEYKNKIEILLKKADAVSDILELDSYVKAAEKEEFKENFKKALSIYQDALFHIKTDSIDDKSQENTIKHLEEKITELKQRLSSNIKADAKERRKELTQSIPCPNCNYMLNPQNILSGDLVCPNCKAELEIEN